MAKKKWVMLAASMSLVAVLAAGCGGGGNDGKETNEPAAQTDAADKPIDIVWTGIFPPEKDDSYVQKYLEKKYNVKIENIRLDRSNWKDQLNVKLAANEIPDVIIGDASMQDLVGYAQQGILAPIDIEEAKRHMPKLTAALKEIDPDDNLWKAGIIDGVHYGVPKLYLEGNTGFMPIYNNAWLKKIGYSEPPKTIDELVDALTKFAKNDPDGNGKNDTYGLSARVKDASSMAFSSIFGAYEVSWTMWKDVDGKLQFGMTTENARQAFKTLAKLYKDGVIDPEFATEDEAQNEQKFLHGKIGFDDNYMWYHFHEDGGLGKKMKEGGLDFVPGKPVSGPFGPGESLAWGTVQSTQAFGADVAKDEAKRFKLYRMYEDFMTDQETYLTTTMGEEGVNYDMVDGIATSKPDWTDPVKRGSQVGAGAYFNIYNGNSMAMYGLSHTQSQVDYRKLINDGVQTVSDDLGPAYLPGMAQYGANLSKLQEEYFLKFILGTVDLDKGFDDFVAAWNNAGGKQVTEEANRIYADRNAK